MSPKIRTLVGSGGVVTRTELTDGTDASSDAGASSKSAKLDRMFHAPDPSKAFLPGSPVPPHRGPEQKTTGAPVELERKAGPALYQSMHFADPSSFMSKEDIELAKRLCHLLDAEAWPRLYAAFQAELEAARANGEPLLPSELDPGWWTEPWCSVESDLAIARSLGFRNVALLGPAGAGPVEFARSEQLRPSTEIDLGGAGQRAIDASWLGVILRSLAEALQRGVLGVRTRGLVGTYDPTTAHALHALIKLYSRVLCPAAVLAPELVGPEARSSLNVGGVLELQGHVTPSEGDLIHWRDGMIALRGALSMGDRGPLDEALQHLPTLLHGARRLCSLEPTDLGGSVLDLLGGDPERLALGFALLYFLPATPVVPARAARVSPVGRMTLQLLNRLWAGHEALAKADLWSVSPTSPNAVFWCRGRPGDASGALALAANLTDRSLEIEVRLERLEAAMHGAPGELRPLGPERARGHTSPKDLRARLPPFGFVFYSA